MSPNSPSAKSPWTAGQLKAALAAIPDDTPLVVQVSDPDNPDLVDEQIIAGAGFGTVDWGDGYGAEQDPRFALECYPPDDPAAGLTRPDRPRLRGGQP